MAPKKIGIKKELENKKKPKPETESESESESTVTATTESETTESETTESETPETKETEKEQSDNIAEIDIKTQPLCFEIKKIKENIFNFKQNIQLSENINYPKFEYGFHHFIHQSKNYINDETKKFEGKKKVWNVLNRYEPVIDNYQQGIAEISKDYFKEISKVDIVNYSFYKLWEIFMYFDLIDLKQDGITTAHILDNTGAFTQATMFYRDMFSKKSKNDKYNFINYKEGTINNIVTIDIDKKLSDDKRIIITKSSDDIKQKCDLITADGGFGEMNENLQEQESPTMLIFEILSAIKNLKKNGHFVCKFIETFTDITLKIISILAFLFDNIYFVKPLLSKLSSSERYVVCMNFKYGENDKELKNVISILENMLDQMMKRKEGSNVVDMFSDFKIPKEIIVSISNMNVMFSNEHFRNISGIITFIRNQVYSGEEYHEKRNEQIEGTKYWTNLYLPKPENIDNARKKIKKLSEESLNISNKNMRKLNKSLIEVK
jgi:23S rRNA U2552 (ribose-2'-O)-methylase RlmE/FtsJ